MNAIYNNRHTDDPVLAALYARLYAAVRAICPRTARARMRDIARRRATAYGEDATAVYCEVAERVAEMVADRQGVGSRLRNEFLPPP